jgi:hypothetical protein
MSIETQNGKPPFTNDAGCTMIQKLPLCGQISLGETNLNCLSGRPGGKCQSKEPRKGNRHLLLRHRHQVLGTKVVAQGTEKVIVCGIWIHAWTSKGVDRGCHRKGRHRPSAPSSGELGRDPLSAEHVHICHHRIPWGVGHHSIGTSGVLMRKLWHASMDSTIF